MKSKNSISRNKKIELISFRATDDPTMGKSLMPKVSPQNMRPAQYRPDIVKATAREMKHQTQWENQLRSLIGSARSLHKKAKGWNKKTALELAILALETVAQK